MAEIKVKITEIDNAITKLQNLQKKCSSANTNAPTTVGGGQTVNELEAIASAYKDINSSFAQMVTNTISFLRNIETSYVESDTKAASKISGN